MSVLADLSALAKSAGFRKLLGVRLVSQVGDGMFQAGLASLFFFSPQSMTSAAGVAAAIAVMFGPYSLVGPFFGPLLDRWRRRQILLCGNAVRCLLALCVAAATWGSAGIGIVYALTLCALGLSRFLLSCLSAGLPSVVGERELLTANSVVPTLGGLAMGIGAVAGFLIRVALPEGASRDVASLFVAALLYLAASCLASLLRPDQLGPKREGLGSQPASPSFRSTVRDLADAAVYLTRRRTPALALATMSLHRFVYEMEFITIILVSRNLLAEPSDADAGLAHFGTLGGAMVAGQFVAVVLTPIAHEKIAPWQWVVTCLIGGSAGQATLVLAPRTGTLAVGAFLVGLGVQGVKIAVDTIVQSDASDAYRGRAFALYDVLFNLGVCAAAGVGLVALPDVGWSRDVQTALFALVWILALVFFWAMARLGGNPRDAGPPAAKPDPPAGKPGSHAAGLPAGKPGPQEGETDPQDEETGRRATGD